METTGTSRRPWLGGVISGIGVSAILMAALGQFTTYNLKNYTIVTIAAGTLVLVAGLLVARSCCRCKDAVDKT